MKVNLLLSTGTPRSGFLNVDPLAPPNDDLRVRGNLSNLDDLVEDAEAEEFVALDVIDFMPANDINMIIDHWLKKIRHGGTITVGGVDIREVAQGLIKQEISIDTANILLYGAQRAPFEYRKASLTLQKLIEVFQDRGLKIIEKRNVNYFYHVKAERP